MPPVLSIACLAACSVLLTGSLSIPPRIVAEVAPAQGGGDVVRVAVPETAAAAPAEHAIPAVPAVWRQYLQPYPGQEHAENRRAYPRPHTRPYAWRPWTKTPALPRYADPYVPYSYDRVSPRQRFGRSLDAPRIDRWAPRRDLPSQYAWRDNRRDGWRLDPRDYRQPYSRWVGAQAYDGRRW